MTAAAAVHLMPGWRWEAQRDSSNPSKPCCGLGGPPSTGHPEKLLLGLLAISSPSLPPPDVFPRYLQSAHMPQITFPALHKLPHGERLTCICLWFPHCLSRFWDAGPCLEERPLLSMWSAERDGPAWLTRWGTCQRLRPAGTPPRGAPPGRPPGAGSRPFGWSQPRLSCGGCRWGGWRLAMCHRRPASEQR